MSRYAFGIQWKVYLLYPELVGTKAKNSHVQKVSTFHWLANTKGPSDCSSSQKVPVNSLQLWGTPQVTHVILIPYEKYKA